MESAREEKLRRLAARQHGALSRAQALDLGFSATVVRGRVSSGTWERLDRGVYAVAGSPSSWERRAMAAVLARGEAAAVSHLAAAYLHGLVETPPDRIDVTVPDTRRGRNAHRVKRFGRQDVRLRRGIPATSVWRTIVDLAAVLCRRELESVTDTSLLRGLVTIPKLRRYIVERHLGCRPGMKVLHSILEDRELGVPESELERQYERLCDRFGIPRATRQLEVGARRVDFAYDDERVIVELDGRTSRERRAEFDQDRARLNELALAMPAHLRLHFTWTHVTERDAWVANTVKRALER